MIVRAGACSRSQGRRAENTDEGCQPAAPPVNLRAFAWTWPRVRACLRCGMEHEARSVRTRCPRCGFVETE